MTATITMKRGTRVTKTTGPVEYCKAVLVNDPAALETLNWAISTREECFGRNGEVEITAMVNE